MKKKKYFYHSKIYNEKKKIYCNVTQIMVSKLWFKITFKLRVRLYSWGVITGKKCEIHTTKFAIAPLNP